MVDGLRRDGKRECEVHDRKEIIGETGRSDMSMQIQPHPQKPNIAALKLLNISGAELLQT